MHSIARAEHGMGEKRSRTRGEKVATLVVKVPSDEMVGEQDL